MDIVLAVATWYLHPFVGRPLFCSTPAQPLTYDAAAAPWIALAIEDDTWRCGDLVILTFANGDVLVATVQDAGPFGDHCVLQLDGTCARIAADVPWHLWPEALSGDLSAGVRVINVSAEARSANRLMFISGKEQGDERPALFVAP